MQTTETTPRPSVALGMGAMSPLWPMFAVAASTGAAFWWMSRFTLGSLPSAAVNLEAALETTPPEPVAERAAEPVEPAPEPEALAVAETVAPVVEPEVVAPTPEPVVVAVVEAAPPAPEPRVAAKPTTEAKAKPVAKRPAAPRTAAKRVARKTSKA